MSEIPEFDIAIIGAGCVGSAIAQRLCKYNVRIALIERAADVAMGATKANSGIIHSGYFTSSGSQKEAMNLRGNPLFDEVCPKIGVEFKRIGAIFCASDEDELKVLENEYELSKKRNVPVELITEKSSFLKLEPELNENIIAVLHFPTTGIIIPFELTVGLAEHAVMNGTKLFLNFDVAIIRKKEGLFTINAADGRHIIAKTIINAAGINSDKIATMVGLDNVKITPRRGEYIMFDKLALPLKKIIFPTPSIHSKGIIVSPTLHGNFFIGPNAMEIQHKEDIGTSLLGLNEIISGASKLLKTLPLRQTITNFAGIRATSQEHDFIIGPTTVSQFVNAAGIDSPGLSSCLAIAEKIEQILRDNCRYQFELKESYIPTRKGQIRLAQLSEDQLALKIQDNPQWGQMVCRCEQVTEAEIVEACHAPIPCTNTDMIKRRLRPGMGRCQGGFCLAKVMKIISREHGIIYEKVTKTGEGSHIVFGRTKNLCSEIFQGEEL
jgi:glycerol-3-phosphate dehydrogenase